MQLFLFTQKTAYDMRSSDWSTDVCSSDLASQEIDVSGSASVADVSRAIIGVVARVSVPNAGLERKRRQDIVLSIAEKCVIADILTGIDRCSLAEQRDGSLGLCFVNLIVGVKIGRASCRKGVCK